MTSQDKSERKHFFEGLDKLDEYGNDEDTTTKPRRTVSGVSPPAPTASTRRHRTLHRPDPPLPLAPASTASDLTPQADGAMSPPPRRSRPPPTLQRAHSDTPTTGQKRKAITKVKKKATMPNITTDQQLFTDFRFYFIPNHDSPYVRALRIDFATAHGARWVRDWDDSVTHILVEPGLNFNELSKALPNKALPSGVPVISDEWISQCYTRKTLLDFGQQRFRMPGMASPYDVDGEEASQKEKVARKQLFTPRRSPRRPAYETPTKYVDAQEAPSPSRDLAASVVAGNEADELDKLIGKMQSSDYLALDNLVRNDPSFKFDDDFVLNPDEYPSKNGKWQCMSKSERM
jgi:hypothetical protein